MSIVPSVSDNEQEISNSITRFICDFKVGSLLKQCGCKKEKGIAFMKLFTYILCNVFRDRSMYWKLQGRFLQECVLQVLPQCTCKLAEIHNSAL